MSTSGPTVFPILGAVVAAVGLLIYQAVSDITVFGLAALLLVLGAILYGVNLLVMRSQRGKPGSAKVWPPAANGRM